MKARKKRGAGLTQVSDLDALDVTTAGELRGHLLQALQAGRSVEIDASAVERVDAAGLQVLCAAAQLAGQEGLQLVCQDPSPTLLRTAVVLGLSGHIEHTELVS